jgi:diguanylate cyclase (GGDEF)-like protein/PAS domain S-box-containing protein
MNKQHILKNRDRNTSRLEPTSHKQPVFELLKVIPGTLFTFQLTGERITAMPYASDRLLRMTGLRPEEVAENAAPLLARINPKDIEPFFTSAQKSAKTMAPWHLEFRLMHPDKREIWLEWQATPVRQGGRLSWHGMLLDITARKSTHWHQELLKDALNQSSDAIFLINEELRFEYVNDATCLNLGYSRKELLSMRPADIAPETDLDTTSVILQCTLVGKSICFETHLLAKNGHLIPVEINAKLIEFGGRSFSLSIARDITEHRRTLEELRHSEQTYRHLVENLPDNVARWDTKGRFLYINPTLESCLSISNEEILGKTISDLNPDIAHEVVSSTANVAATGKPAFIQHLSVLRVNAKTQFHDLKLVPEFDDDGRVTSVLGLGRDMTDFYRAQEIIAASERETRLLQRAINASTDSIFITSLPDRIISVNDAACRSLGYSRDELINMKIEDIDHDFSPERMKPTASQIQSDQARSFETHLRTKDGHIFPVEIVSTSFDDNGKTFMISVARDISERKKSEQALSLSEQAFRSLVENLPDLVIRYDENCRRTFTSPSYERFIGQDGQEVLGKSPLEHWLLPTGRQGAIRFQSHLQQVLDSGRPQEWELISTKANGERATLEFRAAPEFGSDGRVTGVLSVARDITARRAMEQQLRTAASVFDAAKEGIIITDTSGRIFETNPAFSTITGYTRDEVLGLRPSSLASDQHDRSFYRSIWLSLRREGTWTGEIVNRRKNRERYYMQLNIMAMHDENGKPSFYIGIFSDVTSLKLHEQQLQHIAYHDALTGLANRLLLSDRLSQAITRAYRSGKMLAVLYLDLDSFKPINDNFGHEMGDRVLVEVAHRLSNSLRGSDTVARLGGDEFVALVADIPDLSECELTAQRLLDSITQPIILDGNRLTLSASIGISRYPADGSDDTDILLRYADQAMYLAKAAGRNQFLFYGDDSRSQTLNNTQIIHELRLALDQDQISVHYQPIIDITTGQVVKAEALARWKHPEQGMIPPSEFIPAAEITGLIHRIGDLVFEQSVRVAQIWNKRANSPQSELMRICVNLSPRQFFHRDGMSRWAQHLMERNIAGELLTVEITEGLLLEDRQEVLCQLNLFRNMGISISLDDFGTGYSALSYLKKFDIDYLKIDRSFVHNITDDANDRTIVEAIIVMAKRLGIKLVAEGVETRSQAALLAGVDCDMAQGFWYAKPMPEDEFLTFVSQFQGQLP